MTHVELFCNVSVNSTCVAKGPWFQVSYWHSGVSVAKLLFIPNRMLCSGDLPAPERVSPHDGRRGGFFSTVLVSGRRHDAGPPASGNSPAELRELRHKGVVYTVCGGKHCLALTSAPALPLGLCPFARDLSAFRELRISLTSNIHTIFLLSRFREWRRICLGMELVWPGHFGVTVLASSHSPSSARAISRTEQIRRLLKHSP